MSYENGQNVWVNHYKTPRECTFVQSFDSSSKCVVLFHGEPCVHDISDVYSERCLCFGVVSELLYEEAREILDKSKSYRDEAIKRDEPEPTK